MIDVLAPDQPLEELDRHDRPAGDVPGHLLKHRGRPLGLAIAEHVGDEAAHPRFAAAYVLQPARADQGGDIGYHPRLAGLDEPIVIELVDVALDDVELFGEQGGQGLERPARFRVSVPMMLRKEVEQGLGRPVTHGHPPLSA